MNGNGSTPTSDDSDATLDSFLTTTQSSVNDDQLDGFVHNTAPQIARQRLDEYKAGKISLDDDHVVALSKVAQDGVGAWESLGRGVKYIFGHPVEDMKGIGSAIASGTKAVAGASEELTRPEDQLASDLQSGHPIDALWNYGLNKYKSYQQVAQGATRGIAGFAPTLAGATSEAGELATEPFASKEKAQEINAKLNAGTYQTENLKNRAFNRIAEITGTDPNAPLYQVAENVAPLAVPVGGAEAGAGKLATAADRIVDTGARVAGRTIQGTAKTVKTVAPVAAAGALYEAGHPFYALLELGGMYGLAGLRRRIIDAPLNVVADFGKTMSKVPDGETIIGTARQSVDDELSRLSQQLNDLKSKHADKTEDAFKTTADGKPLYTAEELKGPAAEVRGVQDRLTDLNVRRETLRGYEDVNRALSAAARTGIKVGLDTAAAGTIGAAYSGSTESPGEYEQARQGFQAGAAIGLAARAPRIPLMIRGEMRNFNRGDLIRSGRTNVSQDDPNFQAHQESMSSMPVEAQDYVNTYSGLASAQGRKVVVLPPDQFAQQVGLKGEDAAKAPNGYYDSGSKTAFINADALTKGPVPHEVSHALEEAGGFLDEGHPVRQALDQMLTEPKYHRQIQDAIGKYNTRLKESDPNFSSLTPDGVRSEIIADLASDIMQKETPQGLYGGRSLAQKAGELFKRFLGARPTKTSVFGWPVTPELRDSVADSLFQAGEKASERAPQASQPRTGAPTVSPVEAQARSDAIAALSKMRADKSGIEEQVDAAIAGMKQRGEPVTANDLILTAQRGAKPSPKPPPIPVETAPAVSGTASPPAGAQPKIVGPALKTPQGIEKGVIGETHTDLMRKAAAQGNESAIEALLDDQNHLFHDEQGNLHDRVAAAPIAVAAGQAPEGTTSLQSEELGQQRSPVTPSSEAPKSVAEFAASRSPYADALTKEEVTELHRQMDAGKIKDQDSLNRYLEQRMEGQRGEALRAIKTVQDAGQPFAVTFVKSDGSLRTMQAQFGIREGLKGGKKSTAGNPDLYTVYDLDAKGYRTFDINRLQRIQGEGVDYRYKRQFMPSGEQLKWEENEGSDKQAPLSYAGRYVISHRPNNFNLTGHKPYEHLGTFKTLDEAKTAAEANAKQFMPREEPKDTQFNEKIASPAIRVNDLQFTGKTIEEAKSKARQYGLSPSEIGKGEKGFVSNKGKWLTPDQASSFTGENRQMGKQQTESPLSVQAFNRWRRYMPSEKQVFTADQLTATESKEGDGFDVSTPDGRNIFVSRVSAKTPEQAKEFMLSNHLPHIGAKQFMPATQPFYSQLERTIASQPDKASPEQLRAAISKGPGVKQAELRETKDVLGTSFEQFLKDNPKASKSQLLDFVRENQVQIKEITKSADVVPIDPSDSDLPGYDAGEQAGAAKFSEYQLPGGTDYAVTLATLPEGKSPLSGDEAMRHSMLADKRFRGGLTDAEAREFSTMGDRINASRNEFRSSHWDEPNVVLHLRHNMRDTPEGKMLFLEELQSDWAQKGRREGYRPSVEIDDLPEGWTIRKAPEQDWAGDHKYEALNERGEVVRFARTPEQAKQAALYTLNTGSGLVADMPFKSNWKTLGLKVALKKAVESGADSLGWTTGEQQAERYDLSKQLDTVVYNPRSHDLEGYAKGGSDTDEPVINVNVPPEKLPDHIGKEAAEKIVNGTPAKDGLIYLSNQDLKVGGEGMKGFYDKEMVNLANDLVKKWGVRVGDRALPKRGLNVEDAGLPPEQRPTRPGEIVHSLPITESMKRDIMEKGQPLFMPESKTQITTPTQGAKVSVKPVARPERKRKKKSRYTIREKAEA